MAANRATRIEHLERFQVAKQRQMEIRPSTETVDLLARKYQISTRQARRYVVAARLALVAEGERYEGLTFQEGINRALSCQAQACDAGDYKAGVKYLELVARMMGWYAPRQVHHTGTIDHVHSDASTLTQEQLTLLVRFHAAARLPEPTSTDVIEGELLPEPVHTPNVSKTKHK